MDLKKELTLGDVLHMSSGYWKSSTLHCAVKLQVFSHLEHKPLNAREVAQKINGDQLAVEHLLHALVALGLLYKDKHVFRNTELSSTFLVRNSSGYAGHIIMHHFHLVDAWAQLDKAVLSGGTVTRRSFGEELERESFLMGMYNTAMAVAPRLAQEIDLSGRTRILDIGGGPGTFAIYFCLQNAHLQGTIFDRPTTRPYAEKLIKQYGLQERISFVSGDFTIDSFSGTYDVAWLSHILHSNSKEQCEKLLKKTASVLEPGGIIMVHDFFLDEDKTKPLFPALFSLNMLLNNGVGRSYTDKETREMLGMAGFKKIERLPFQGPNDSSIIRGYL